MEDLVLDDVDVFWQHTSAQVQILDTDGNLLMDSLGVVDENVNNSPDVKRAINGNRGKWIGRVDYYDNYVMAISVPIYNQSEYIGIIRFLTSLRN